jgi:hypothetical protein
MAKTLFGGPLREFARHHPCDAIASNVALLRMGTFARSVTAEPLMRMPAPSGSSTTASVLSSVGVYQAPEVQGDSLIVRNPMIDGKDYGRAYVNVLIT